MEQLLIIAAAALWGGGTGLLIPRAAYRFSVAPDERWRAACPAGHPITGLGRGWIGRARCADGTPYGPNAPILAAVTALVCATLASATGIRPELGVWLLLVPIGVLLATVDLAAHRLPDVLTLPLATAALTLLAVTTLLPGTEGRWTTALLGSVVLAVGYFALFLISPKGIGFGDVKLAIGLGAVLGWYGWAIVLVGSLAGFLLGALYGVGLILARRASRTTSIPFAPFLLGGALIGIFLGAQ
ncbi:leader peptidase (prepilin peptidase)/N-methyltransferase [Streptomyces sp. V4I8]|uniref:prepilin peptidase n=1 Tax=Streptomyces sp. V4I8 TaxID=3156469 RepID=UPI0035158B3B